MYKGYDRSRFKMVFTKLQVLNCSDYAKVLMLDLDMLVRSSLEELFQLRAPAAMKRASGREQPSHGGTFGCEDIWRNERDEMNSGINAGVMLLEPSSRIYGRMVSEIRDSQHPEHVGTHGPEQDYLSRFYCTFGRGCWTHFHPRFNYQLGLPRNYVSSAYRGIDIHRDVVVAHYSGTRVKPWKLDPDMGVKEVRRLLEDDTIREHWNRPTRRPVQSGERNNDGMDVHKEEGLLSDEELTLMWEWVLALRNCAAELREQAGVNILEVCRAGTSERDLD